MSVFYVFIIAIMLALMAIVIALDAYFLFNMRPLMTPGFLSVEGKYSQLGLAVLGIVLFVANLYFGFSAISFIRDPLHRGFLPIVMIFLTLIIIGFKYTISVVKNVLKIILLTSLRYDTRIQQAGIEGNGKFHITMEHDETVPLLITKEKNLIVKKFFYRYWTDLYNKGLVSESEK